MLLACDVDYRDPGALAAGVLFERFDSAAPARTLTVPVEAVEPYVPGAFYQRELPCLRALLARVPEPLEAILIDGYVTLDAAGRPGLGAHLYEALGRAVPVVGVAKTAFAGAPFALEVLRGASTSPLYVTAVGLDARVAAAQVRAMHGPFRLPTLLKLVDQLARSG